MENKNPLQYILLQEDIIDTIKQINADVKEYGVEPEKLDKKEYDRIQAHATSNHTSTNKNFLLQETIKSENFFKNMFENQIFNKVTSYFELIWEQKTYPDIMNHIVENKEFHPKWRQTFLKEFKYIQEEIKFTFNDEKKLLLILLFNDMDLRSSGQYRATIATLKEQQAVSIAKTKKDNIDKNLALVNNVKAKAKTKGTKS